MLLTTAIPEQTFTGQHSLQQWSDQPEMLLSYLSYSNFAKTDADKVIFQPYADEYVEEVMGFWELLKKQPFLIEDQIAEINGEAVIEYLEDCPTF